MPGSSQRPRLSLSPRQEATGTPCFRTAAIIFVGSNQGAFPTRSLLCSHAPAPVGPGGRPACLPAYRAATLGASARRARPQASWPQTRRLRGGKLRATAGEAMTRAQSTSPLQTPTPAPLPPPAGPTRCIEEGDVWGGAGDEERGGASARRSPLRTHQAQGPPRSCTPLLPGCEEWQAPPAG